MFKKIFDELCIQKNVAPTTVCLAIGLSKAAYSEWTEKTTPRRTTIKKIADYFGVTPEYFTGTIAGENGISTPILTADEQELIMYYKEIGQMLGTVAQKGILTYMKYLLDNQGEGNDKK